MMKCFGCGHFVQRGVWRIGWKNTPRVNTRVVILASQPVRNSFTPSFAMYALLVTDVFLFNSIQALLHALNKAMHHVLREYQEQAHGSKI